MSTSEGQSKKSSQSAAENEGTQRKPQGEAGKMLRDFLHRTGLDNDLEQLVAHVARQGINNVWKTFTPIEGVPGSYELPPDEPRKQKTSVDPDDPYEIMGVHRNTPPEILKAVYLAWAKNHHPDVGGDPETFKKVNAAWDQIRKERKI